MSIQPDVLWLSTSPSLQRFNQPALSYLSHYLTVGQWEYSQTPDEPSSLDVASLLLNEYLNSCDRPVHLIGHSTSGLLGLLYARRHPEKVKSLTLLAVGADPAVDWQAQYYMHRQLLKGEEILEAMVYNLFGYHDKCTMKSLIKRLQQDLDNSLSPHSLLKCISIPPGSVSVPLMVCGGTHDIIVEPDAMYEWQPHLKQHDRLWICPQGKHFFHFFQYQLVSEQILQFWQSLPASASFLTACYQLPSSNRIVTT